MSKTPAADSASGALTNSVISKFFNQVNFYGSVNYDEASGVTNDITMSLGFFRSNVEELVSKDEMNAMKDPNLDNTFDIAGFQVGKDIFYDLLNSFKAMQASMTFKFEKKKVAALIRSTPRIINSLTAKNSAPKTAKIVKISAKEKPQRLESVQDLLTAPQLYLDIAKLLNGQS